MNRRVGWWLGLALVTLAGLALRLVGIDTRPVHTDEAVHAVKFQTLWADGVYVYDAADYHGPTIYYAAAVLRSLTGAESFSDLSIVTLRLTIVFFSLGMLWLLPLLRDALTWPGVLAGAFLLSVSPAFAYYGNYYIQETVLVFFTLLALASGWRWWRTGRAGWAWLAGFALGAMAATKETFVLTVGAAIVASGFWLIRSRVRRKNTGGPETPPPRRIWQAALAASGVAVVTAAMLLTAGFTQPTALVDFVVGYVGHVGRTTGGLEGLHLHPWWFYAHRILFFHPAPGPVWSEAALVALAGVGSLAVFRSGTLANATRSFGRWLVVATVVLGVTYSLFPYKTPWLVLSPLLGLTLLAGIGVAWLLALVRHPGTKTAIAVIILAATAYLPYQAWLGQTRFVIDPRNPYAYAQTNAGAPLLEGWLLKLAASDSEEPLRTAVVAADPWPLPWYLRKIGETGYYDTLPPLEPFDVIIVDQARWDALRDQLPTDWPGGIYGLRRDLAMVVYVRPALQAAFEAREQ